MDGIFGTMDDDPDRVFLTPENLILPSGYGDFLYDSIIPSAHRIPGFQAEEGRRYQCSEYASVIGQSQREGKKKYYYYDQDQDQQDATTTDIKAKIASHPNYTKLLDAYIDCKKVGAPPEMAWFLDDIRREKDTYTSNTNTVALCLGMDPELDEFMETYYDTLVKLKADLSRPFDEATSFLNKIETQLGNLCKDDGGLSSDDELSGGESEVRDYGMKMEDRELKQSLLRRYGSHINSLKMEFSKKKKKGKLPKNARLTLLEWWNGHYKWPYPTEGDKILLAESTGLDQKQINNWFINQRKRHWKPSENMHLAMMGNLAAEFLGEQ